MIEFMLRDRTTLYAVGDIMMGDHPLCIGHGVRSKINKNGSLYLFSNITPILREADLVFGNLEAVISDTNLNSSELYSAQLRAPREAINGLKYSGINLLSLANNHALEHGHEALIETAKILIDLGIKVVGIEIKESDRRAPCIVTSNGIRIAFLAYCLVRDKTSYLSINDISEIISDINETKAMVDVVVVSLHWGDEYIQIPSPTQVILGHKIIDAGADLILGQHPHVIKGIEPYKHGLIAYSLGNFIFDSSHLEKTRSSFILQCIFSKKGLVKYKLVPLYLNRDYAPIHLNGIESMKVLDEIETLSKKIKYISYEKHEKSMDYYLSELSNVQKDVSKRTKIYFLKNIYRYPPRFAGQMLLDYIRRCLR